MPSLSDLPGDRLKDMAVAAAEVAECHRLLAKTQANVVGELLKGLADFFEWDHYPKGDVYDPETHSQYYYHAHPIDLRAGEHGHFHTFLRPKGMPPGITPAPVDDYAPPEGDNDALSHLVAVSMDEFGRPIRLFTTNRWVTGEVWYRAPDVTAMLDYFHIDLAYPSLVVNLWLNGLLRMFRPEIEMLLDQRDTAVAAWAAKHPDRNVFEDRELEIASALDISVDERIAEINTAVASASASSP